MAGPPTEPNKADMLAANVQRMVALINQLSTMLRTEFISVQQLEQPLLLLVRGIDFSVANGDVLSKASELCSLVKQICLRKGDHLLLPLIMAFMVSVKNACQHGWFSDADAKEIINLYKEIRSSFSLPQMYDDEISASNPHIQTIMERFYPQLSLGNIIACHEVKAGYGAYLVDFHISKNAEFLPLQNIRLFVAQTDTTETSACLISPQQANFLLNGKGIVGRVYTTLDAGPQIPTNVTAMLQLGTNLLQVVGHFSGNYVIVIASMDAISFPIPNLEYVQLDFTSQSLDSDVIVGSSRVCLNCPISHTRIKTPVKGKSCKHLQCFDLDNYVGINSRRPSWRCPHCNQYVSFLDIRVDQNMMKVLNEVGKNVEDVIISPDGSWNNTPNSNANPSSDSEDDHMKESDAQDILDLTTERDVMDTDQISEHEERKQSEADLLNPTGLSVGIPNESNISNVETNGSRTSQMDDDFWSGLDPSGNNSGPSNDRTDNQFMINAFHPSERAPGSLGQLSSPCMVNVPERQSLPVSSVMDNQYARVPVPPNTSRAPITDSGLPNSRLTSSVTPASMISSGMGSPSIAFSAGGATTTVNSELERLREHSRSSMNRFQLPDINLHRLQQHSMAQSRDAMRSYNHNSSTQTAASVPGSQYSNPQRMASVHQDGYQNRLNHLPQQSFRIPNMSAGMAQTHPHLWRTNYQQTRPEIGATSSSNHGRIPARHILTSRPAFRPLRQQTPSLYQNQALLPGQLYPANVPRASVQHPHGAVQQVSRAENLVTLSADPNMRPAGRMRGSLSGRAYEDAYNQFMSPATQATRGAPRAPTSVPAGVPPELHEMITNLPAPNSDVLYQ